MWGMHEWPCPDCHNICPANLHRWYHCIPAGWESDGDDVEDDSADEDDEDDQHDEDDKDCEDDEDESKVS